MRVEEGLLSSFYGGGNKPWVHSNCAGDLRELLRVPLRNQGYCGAGTRLLGLHWVSCNGRGANLEWRQEPQRSSRDFTGAGLIRIANTSLTTQNIR